MSQIVNSVSFPRPPNNLGEALIADEKAPNHVRAIRR